MKNSSTVRTRRRIEDAPLPQPLAEGIKPSFDVEAWAKQTAKPGDWFDENAANHACEFFPRYLRHTKGQWAGQPFHLTTWERGLVRAAFGWKRKDGRRRFRTIYVEIARKNGKTALAAGIALYLAFAAGEAGAEVYCAASDTKQAMICFNEAKRMRSQSPFMKQITNAFKFNINAPETFSKIEVLSSEAGTKDGLNIHGLIGDEYHAWKDRLLQEVLHTATGARTEPLELYITTAGIDRNGICYETRQHAVRVRDGLVDDHEFLPVIFAANDNDPIDDPKTWEKANPNIGITISYEYLAKEAARAKALPRYLNAFKRLHLNIWTESETVWIPASKWNACNLEPVNLTVLAGRSGYHGLDLSAVTDLTALAGAFPREGSPIVDLWAHFWMPKEAINERVRKDRVPYDQWAEQGFITLTDGNVVDYDVIRAMISGVTQAGQPAILPPGWPGPLNHTLRIVDIARDRWNATQISNQLMGDGIAMVDFGQGYASMSAPAKEFEKLVLAQQLNHGGNPVLAWMLECCTIVTDPAGNIKPVKPDRRETTKRIDGIVAAIMALGRLMAEREDDMPTITYESGDMYGGVAKAEAGDKAA